MSREKSRHDSELSKHNLTGVDVTFQACTLMPWQHFVTGRRWAGGVGGGPGGVGGGGVQT